MPEFMLDSRPPGNDRDKISQAPAGGFTPRRVRIKPVHRAMAIPRLRSLGFSESICPAARRIEGPYETLQTSLRAGLAARTQSSSTWIVKSPLPR